jgi:DNA uptake protein ComE-like DNA-binding protein
MKTILSLLALSAFVGLLPFALAESKTAKPPKTNEGIKAVGTAKGASAAAARSSVGRSGAEPVDTLPSAGKAKADEASKEASATKDSAPTQAKEKLPLTAAQQGRLLALLNEGTYEELDAIPGIASARADAIVSARPYQHLHEITLVAGVGGATFEKILAHGKALGTTAAGRSGSKTQD